VLDRSAIVAESEEDHNLTVFKQFIEGLPDSFRSQPPQRSDEPGQPG
jgi:hypothetical protein